MLNADHFIEKMKNWRFCFGINLLLAVGIFLCALLGRSLGIQGPVLAISVIWPATGLSLAALLIFGYRTGVGVFVGNFAYNLLFLIKYPHAVSSTPLHNIFFMAIFISMGSFVQALISAYIIRTFSTSLFFRTVQDVFIFLFPASILSCLIGSTVGVAALAILGGLDKSLVMSVWLTFWLGDTVGIYVITPLLVIWTLQPQEIRFSDHIPSIICIVFFFAVFSFATYFFDYPLPHLFVPISIWAAYLFRMHGASLAIFLMAASSVTFAAFHGYEGTSLISLISFIAITIAASLIIAAVVIERAQAWALLDSRNLYLEKEVDVKVKILEHVRSEASQKRKLTTQDSASKSSKMLTLQIDAAFSQIERIIINSQEALEEIQKLLTEQNNLTTMEKKLFAEKLIQIRQGLSDTLNLRKVILDLLKD